MIAEDILSGRLLISMFCCYFLWVLLAFLDFGVTFLKFIFDLREIETRLLFYGVILLPERDPWLLSIPSDDPSTGSFSQPGNLHYF